jgi:hypothetical protein
VKGIVRAIDAADRGCISDNDAQAPVLAALETGSGACA